MPWTEDRTIESLSKKHLASRFLAMWAKLDPQGAGQWFFKHDPSNSLKLNSTTLQLLYTTTE